MKRSYRLICMLAAIALLAVCNAKAERYTLNFDGVASGQPINRWSPGLIFSEPLHGGYIYANGHCGRSSKNGVSLHASWPAAFAAEEGAVDVTFAKLQKDVRIDANVDMFIERLDPLGRKPFLQAFDSSGRYLGTVYYNVKMPLGSLTWQTLRITRPTADIKRVRFSSQNNYPGATGHYTYHDIFGIFDNLNYDR